MNKLCMVVGHKESAQGAVNKDSGVTEWGWNSEFVLDIGTDLFDRDWGCVVGNETLGSWINKNVCYQIFYRTSTITDLVNRINEWNPDLAIEFHCNAFDRKVSGTEMLVSKYYAKHLFTPHVKFLNSCQILSMKISESLGIINRDVGFRSRWRRGGYFLNKTKCKAIIAESFFIDNNSDLAKANENRPALVQAVVDWIVNYFKEV